MATRRLSTKNPPRPKKQAGTVAKKTKTYNRKGARDPRKPDIIKQRGGGLIDPVTGLNTDEKAFCIEFLKDMNATQAVIRAGYSTKGASEKGSRLLKKPEIQAYITKENEARLQRIRVDADRVLEEAAYMAFSDIRDFMSWSDGTMVLKSSDQLTEVQARAIQSVSERTTKYGTDVNLTLYDKRAALDLVGKHVKIGAWKDASPLDLFGAGGPVKVTLEFVDAPNKRPDPE